MRIFILKAGSVEVVEPFNDEPHYVNVNYPKGQVFRTKYVNSRQYWDCLHRSVVGRMQTVPLWVYAHKVPDEVKLAAMIVN